jgi:hypothetical protein
VRRGDHFRKLAAHHARQLQREADLAAAVRRELGPAIVARRPKNLPLFPAWWQRGERWAHYHATLQEKYLRAARPWLPIVPDPPEPE